MIGCRGKLYTNLDATHVIRTCEHADGRRVDLHTLYQQQQLNELKRLAAGDPRPVTDIYDDLAIWRTETDRTLPGITENISVPLWSSFRLTYTSFGTNSTAVTQITPLNRITKWRNCRSSFSLLSDYERLPRSLKRMRERDS
ncbi:hypothetical protein T01_9714 [Trichinella spiralis]|uniref:Uncharacterized protein n=1 Tax=Trichinella spiralis TaxID=6334 RepID=A0A0V1AQP9_TRISP|nr:hypothetical protein T01_9714 [Trichinella spiralis]